MGKVGRTYIVGGVPVKPPVAQGGGDWMTRNRYKLIAEGLASCWYACPRSDKVLMTVLQQAWVEAEREMARLPLPPDGQGVIGFGE